MIQPAQSDDWNYSPVPTSAVRLFRMCWQLEVWLRTIVYVELRANQIDWEAPIKKKVQHWPPNSLASDKRQHHMSTPHQAGVSYLTFGQLWDVMSSPDVWNLFAPYFPPKANTDARIEEVKTIRNRVAHFREPHPQDSLRLELFMRDMELGIRRFCRRYTASKVPRDPADDPVSSALEQEWSHIGYGIELQRPHGWLYAPTPNRQSPLMNARLEMLTHQDYQSGSMKGVIYRATVIAGSRSKGRIDAVDLFDSTHRIHGDVIHFMVLPCRRELSLTVPAIHGAEKTAQIVGKFLQAGLTATRSSMSGQLSSKRSEWPEYVIWPDDMLAFFEDDMPNPVLDID